MASSITQPGYRAGQPPASAGQTLPPEGLTPDEARASLRSPSPKAPTGMRNRALLVVLAVATAVAIAVGGVIPGLALAASSPFRIVTSPQPGQTRLHASVAISATDVWAVGGFNGDTNTLAEHWNGSVWQVVATPNPPQSKASLNAVSAVSSTDVWAAGNTFSGEHASSVFIEHWNGTKWSIVASPSLAQSTPQLNSIVAISSTDVYAVGDYFVSNSCAFGTLVEHWDGSTWSIIPTAAPCEAGASGVSASSASDVWVVGSVGNMQATAFTEHFNGHAWRIVPSPASPTINAVVDLSPTNAWAVGGDISHWNGTSWKVVATLKSGSGLGAITSVSATDLWAVGSTAVGNNPRTTLAEHFNGTVWSVVPTPNPNPATFTTLEGVSSTTSGHVYAVGFTAPDNFTINGLILENDNG